MLEKQSQDKVDVFEMILKPDPALWTVPGKSVEDTKATVFAVPSQKEISEDWHEDHQEGQLAVDVINKDKELIVVSTMAGADTSKIEVYIHNDLLTIRGVRIMPVDGVDEAGYLHQECYWGKFSRTVILPVNVKGDKAKAEYKNGVLKIIIPKNKADSKIPITIIDE